MSAKRPDPASGCEAILAWVCEGVPSPMLSKQIMALPTRVTSPTPRILAVKSLGPPEDGEERYKVLTDAGWAIVRYRRGNSLIIGFMVSGPHQVEPPDLEGQNDGLAIRRVGSRLGAIDAILLHGVGHDSMEWVDVMCRCEGLNIVAPDFNRLLVEAKHRRRALAALAEVLGGFASEHGGVPPGGAVVGHSLGGHLALELSRTLDCRFVCIEGPIMSSADARRQDVRRLSKWERVLVEHNVDGLFARDVPSSVLLADRLSGRDADRGLTLRRRLAAKLSATRPNIEVTFTHTGHEVVTEAPDEVASAVLRTIARTDK